MEPEFEIEDTKAEDSELETINLKIDCEGVAQNISEGFLKTCLPEAEEGKKRLEELLQNQTILIETVQQENMKFNNEDNLAAVLEEAKMYHNKLIALKKEMAMLHDKSTSLKKRSLKLQQQKQKERLQYEEERDREIQKESLLNAQIAKSGTV